LARASPLFASPSLLNATAAGFLSAFGFGEGARPSVRQSRVLRFHKQLPRSRVSAVSVLAYCYQGTEPGASAADQCTHSRTVKIPPKRSLGRGTPARTSITTIMGEVKIPTLLISHPLRKSPKEGWAPVGESVLPAVCSSGYFVG
jgi:hypothetical protein